MHTLKAETNVCHSPTIEQYCINDGEAEEESSEDEDDVPIVKGLNHVEEKSFHRAAKRIIEKGDDVFRKPETREVTTVSVISICSRYKSTL